MLRYWTNGPGLCQYWAPCTSLVGRPPQTRTKACLWSDNTFFWDLNARTIKFRPMMRRIFKIAKENSISPYIRTSERLQIIARPPKIVIQTALFKLTQNSTSTAAATISPAMEIKYAYAMFHPWAKESAGSKKYSACRTIPPLRGTRALSQYYVLSYKTQRFIHTWAQQ